MKISELSTDRAADVLCETSVYISNICGDKEVMGEISKELKLKGGESTVELVTIFMGKLSQLSPLLLKKHKNDVFGIIAAVNGMTFENVAKQNFLVTLGQIKELFSDKKLIDFFRSAVSVVKK